MSGGGISNEEAKECAAFLLPLPYGDSGILWPTEGDSAHLFYNFGDLVLCLV